MNERRWLIVFSAGLLAAGCGPSQSPVVADTGPRYGNVLNIHVSPDPFNWDITFSRSIPNQDGVALTYSSLLGFKKGPEYEFNQLELEPELAEGWEIAWRVHNTGKAVVKIGPEAECVRVGNILGAIGLVVTVVQS